GKLMGHALATSATLPAIVYGKITDASGKPLANASVEVREPGQPDRGIPASAAGEYAFTISSTARCDLFITTGKLSAYRLGFRPGGDGAQKLDWTLAETQAAKSEIRNQKSEIKKSLLTPAATNF